MDIIHISTLKDSFADSVAGPQWVNHPGATIWRSPCLGRGNKAQYNIEGIRYSSCRTHMNCMIHIRYSCKV